MKRWLIAWTNFKRHLLSLLDVKTKDLLQNCQSVTKRLRQSSKKHSSPWFVISNLQKWCHRVLSPLDSVPYVTFISITSILQVVDEMIMAMRKCNSSTIQDLDILTSLIVGRPSQFLEASSRGKISLEWEKNFPTDLIIFYAFSDHLICGLTVKISETSTRRQHNWYTW